MFVCVCVCVYITSQSVWPFKKFVFHNLKVLFLIKQLKHLNVFIYYGEYNLLSNFDISLNLVYFVKFIWRVFIFSIFFTISWQTLEYSVFDYC